MDIWLHNVHGLATRRPTMDMDFSVAVNSWIQFAELKNRLIATGNFAPTRTIHRLLYKNKAPVDLVPFGGVEKPSGKIVWPPNNDQAMNVTGFQDINTAAQEINLSGTLSIRAASLPGLMISKLFSWDDRREKKDAWDIITMLHDYEHTQNADRPYEDADLLTSSSYDMELVGCALLGRDIAAISCADTMTALQTLLHKDTEQERLVTQMATAINWVGDDQLSAAQKRFDFFLAGLSKNRQPENSS
jgi:predicted nucleotidyltransferase